MNSLHLHHKLAQQLTAQRLPLSQPQQANLAFKGAKRPQKAGLSSEPEHGRLMKKLNYELRANRKWFTGPPHPERDL